jgi:uncharacterized membrane protein
MTLYILIFLLFSFLGWIIDTAFSSIFIYKRFKPSGYFKNLPLCPIYGIGGIVIFQIFSQLSSCNPFVVISVTTLFVMLLEYLGGVFCVKFLNERLWDYSKSKFSLHGHIDLLHSFFWLVLITLLYFLTSPFFDDISRVSQIIIEKTVTYDMYISAIFIIVLLGLTVRTKENREKEREMKE